MKSIFTVVLVISLISLGLSEQPQQQQQEVQLAKFLQGWVPKVKRTFRSLHPIAGNGLQTFQRYPSSNGVSPIDYSIQLRPRAPRISSSSLGNYQLPLYANAQLLNSYRRYRSNTFPISLPSLDTPAVGDEEENIVQYPSSSSEQMGRLRFLGWLFGRPSVSPYPDYSVLEQAAGIPYGSRFPSHGYPRPHSPMVVEECVELLDPLTGHVMEECQDMPYYH